MKRSVVALVCSTLLAGAALLPGCAGYPPLYQGMGSFKRTVSTSNPEAQAYFTQGLVWAYSFNHNEAIRAFQRAADLDPQCAMAWWGIAYCNGPHINNPSMDEAHSKAAWNALARARDPKNHATPAEHALIEALAERYANPAEGALPLSAEQRGPWDRNYAAAMARVYERYSLDDDVSVLYAESLMDLHPWDLYGEGGVPRSDTPRIVSVLESVLTRTPGHPGAMHLYIHAVEGSPNPERAMTAADRLRAAVPASGHMVHMPSHIDVRTGRWPLASDQNMKAIKADDAMAHQIPSAGFYRLYMAHNHHFLAYSCMMEGRSATAIGAAHDMVAGVPSEFIRQSPDLVDAYASIQTEVLVRFGKWDQLLAASRPPTSLPITTAMWRMGRAVAFAAKGQTGEARSEYDLFKQDVAAVPPGAMMAQNPAATVLSIADHLVAGEIAFREGNTDEAVRHLRAGAATEDTLKYIEPPDWIQPVRHTLGAVLLAAGRIDEAEQVYRDDLLRWPENGWSLFGLAKCLKAKNSPEADGVQARFRKAWARADFLLESSCLCVPAGK